MKLYGILLLIISSSLFSRNTFYDPQRVSQDGYYSQCGQDRFLNENFFKNKKDGVFIEVGAYDGVVYSNTKFFEDLGWRGICIEPMPNIFQELKANRKCLCVQGCISSERKISDFLWVSGKPDLLSGLIDKFDPRHLERLEKEVKDDEEGIKRIIKVNCYVLNDILEENGFFHIDFLSLDTEGGELDILRSIDFDRFQIDFIDVENNYHDHDIRDFLYAKGYELITNTGWDDIFQKKY